MGALACVERSDQVARFLDPGRTSRTLIQTPADNPNRRLLMLTMVGEPQPGSYSLSNIALAPGQANGCGASYRTITWVNLPCEKAQAAEFPTVKFTRIDSLAVSAAVINQNMWIVTMPAGPGCVIEKEETVQ